MKEIPTYFVLFPFLLSSSLPFPFRTMSGHHHHMNNTLSMHHHMNNTGNPHGFFIPKNIVEKHRILQRYVHILGGVFIWEFLSTIWFEWSFISRKRPYRWSIWVYGVIRVVTLVNVLANLIQDDLSSSIGCQGWLYFEFTTAYLAMMLASLLLILKIAAIWNKNRRILATCIIAWLVNLAFAIRCIASTKARHSRALGSCVLRDGGPNRDATLATLCSEMILLIFMLTGLVRQRDHYLGRLLFHHGLVWLLVAIFAQVPLLVLLSLNPSVQDLGNLVFHSSSLLSIAICVTRLYRSLSMIKEYQRRPKSLYLSSNAPNPIVFPPFTSSYQTRSERKPLPELPRLTLSIISESSDDALDDDPLEKQKHTDMATFGDHHV